MSARSRRKNIRVFGNDTAVANISNANPTGTLQLSDVLCCVCRSVLVEPVSLPCNHRFCRACWLATDALRCPLCRKRFGSWLRESARRNHLVDEELWRVIREQFPTEITNKLNGVDLDVQEEYVSRRLSAPGEIRAEYEAELQRQQAERLQVEQKIAEEAEILARKLQEEEEATHKIYLDKLKQDEELARQLQENEKQNASKLGTTLHGTVRHDGAVNTNNKAKKTTIERYLVKKTPKQKLSPIIKNGEKSCEASTENNLQPNLLPPPKYGSFLNDFNDIKIPDIKQKDSANCCSKNDVSQKPFGNVIDETYATNGPKLSIRTKGALKQYSLDPLIQSESLRVSTPYLGILNKNMATLVKENKQDSSASSDSVDSMRQELCYFKPIQTSILTSRLKLEPKEAIRVPAVRRSAPAAPAPAQSPPDYLYGLRLLRGELSSSPSAFVCLINLQGDTANCDISEVKVKPKVIHKTPGEDAPTKHVYSFRRKPSTTSQDKYKKLRRTRSTSNTKLITEITPCKRAHSKHGSTSRQKGKSKSESKVSEIYNGNPIRSSPTEDDKVKLVRKNLSSPLELCGTVILSKNKYEKKDCSCNVERNNNLAKKSSGLKPAEYISVGIDKQEQEKKDLELALRVEAEWNGGYALRRAPVKRRPAPPPLPLMLARAKKIKI